MIDSSVSIFLFYHSRELHEVAAVHAESIRNICDKVKEDGVKDCPASPSYSGIVFERVIRGLFCIILPTWPKVSVITPTWQRKKLLMNRCVPSVKNQEYEGDIEHIIVSDGPDSDLCPMRGLVMLREHRYFRNRGLSARIYGTRMATGDVIAYLDDDNAWRPSHLSNLVRALSDTSADFAYSRAMCHKDGFSYTIGIDPPVLGQIDTSVIVHRRELLDIEDWQPSNVPADWDLVNRWVSSGASYVFVPEVTLDYYVRQEVSEL